LTFETPLEKRSNPLVLLIEIVNITGSDALHEKNIVLINTADRNMINSTGTYFPKSATHKLPSLVTSQYRKGTCVLLL
jgi:hypothetical protein